MVVLVTSLGAKRTEFNAGKRAKDPIGTEETADGDEIRRKWGGNKQIYHDLQSVHSVGMYFLCKYASRGLAI